MSIVKGLISAEEVVPGKPQAVIWVMTETVTTAQMSVSVSLLVDEALASKGIERRRILSGQDLAKAEPWLRNAVSGAGGDSCLILVGSSGHELRPLPASIDDFIKEIQSW
ncbi:MAG: hypothetical protein GY906_02300 [bacterium]|nr:hypothetical protein [bacterium]